MNKLPKPPFVQHQLLRLSFLQDQFLPPPPPFRLVSVPKTPLFRLMPVPKTPRFWVVPVPKTPIFGLCPCLRPPFCMCRATHPPVYIESAPPPRNRTLFSRIDPVHVYKRLLSYTCYDYSQTSPASPSKYLIFSWKLKAIQLQLQGRGICQNSNDHNE